MKENNNKENNKEKTNAGDNKKTDDNNKIDIPYDVKFISIGKENIHQFKFSRFRRTVRASQIKSMIEGLREGKHFIEPFLVVEISPGVYEQIDGNHRLEAIKKHIKKEPDFEIVMEVRILTEIKYPINEEKEKAMKEVYHRVARAVKQSTKDYVEAYSNEIPIYKPLSRILDEYDRANPFKQIPIHNMLDAYLAARTKGAFKGMRVSKPKILVDEAKKMNGEDVEIMRQFYSDLYNMFRLNEWRKNKKPDCLKTTGFSILFYIWKHNIDKMGRKKFVRLFREKIRDNKKRYYEFEKIAKRPGVGASKTGQSELVILLNEGLKNDDNEFALQ